LAPTSDQRASGQALQSERWLTAHPRFHLHFTATGASWINLVERWLAELTARKAQTWHSPLRRQGNATAFAWLRAR